MANIVGTVLKADLTPVIGQWVTFRRTDAPITTASDVQTGHDIRAVTSSFGTFNLTAIGPGEFYVWVPGCPRRRILVPDDSGTYALDDLLGHA